MSTFNWVATVGRTASSKFSLFYRLYAKDEASLYFLTSFGIKNCDYICFGPSNTFSGFVIIGIICRGRCGFSM